MDFTEPLQAFAPLILMMLGIFAFFAVLIAILGALGYTFHPGGPKPYSDKTVRGYQLVSSINNKSEREMIDALIRRFGNRFHICPKVRMEDVISVRRNAGDFSHRQSLRGRVKSRHFDAVITTPYGKPVAAVEFDGPTHTRRQERKTDAFKNEICAAVGLALLRVDYRHSIEDQVLQFEI